MEDWPVSEYEPLPRIEPEIIENLQECLSPLVESIMLHRESHDRFTCADCGQPVPWTEDPEVERSLWAGRLTCKDCLAARRRRRKAGKRGTP
jgi:hypothetical protein